MQLYQILPSRFFNAVLTFRLHAALLSISFVYTRRLMFAQIKIEFQKHLNYIICIGGDGYYLN